MNSKNSIARKSVGLDQRFSFNDFKIYEQIYHKELIRILQEQMTNTVNEYHEYGEKECCASIHSSLYNTNHQQNTTIAIENNKFNRMLIES